MDFDTNDRYSLLDLGPPTGDMASDAPADARPLDLDPAPAPAPVAVPVPAPVAQDVERIDEAGKARATADLAAARAAGFGFQRETVYAVGTVVNSLGVTNATVKRLDWENKPSLREAVGALVEQVKSERRVDKKRPLTDLYVTPDGRLGLRENGGATAIRLTERGLETLATSLVTSDGGTVGGARYLANCPPELRAENINFWLPQQVRERIVKDDRGEHVRVKEPREVTLRCRRGTDGKCETYAVGGPRYTAFDVDRVGESVERALRGVGDSRAEVKYDGHKATIDVSWHTNVQPDRLVAGEIFRVGLRVRAADDGSGSINVSMLAERNLCRNLIILDFAKSLIGRRRHVGNVGTIEDTVSGYLDLARERLGHFTKAWDNATVENVLDRYNLHDVDEVLTGLVRNKVVWVAGVTPDEMEARLRRAWDKEPGYSRAAFVNAITRAAHEEPWASSEDSEDLESKAGELLFAKVWNCTPPAATDAASLLEF